MKKIYLLFLITIPFLIYNFKLYKNEKENVENLNYKVGDNLPVSRALVAKMVSLLLSNKEEINNTDKKINFEDIKEEDWYYKYINFVSKEDLIDSFNNKFYPEKPITLEEAQKILNKIDKNNKIKIKLTEETKNRPISYALWCELYCKILKNLSQKNENINISEEDYIILATKNNSKLIGDYILTNKGLFFTEGIVNDFYIDKEIKVLEKEKEVIAILNINNKEPIIKNAYIVDANNSNITIFSGGVEKSYKFNNKNFKNEDIKGSLCDIKIKDNKCIDINIYKNLKKGKINKIDENYIEIDREKINLDKDFKVYSLLDGKVKIKEKKNILVGTDTTDIIIKDNKAIGAIINSIYNIDKIRVLISTTNFENFLHKEVILTGTKDFKVIKNNKEKNIKAKEIVKLKKNSIDKKDKIYIKPEKDGFIEIKSIKRNYKNNESPKYRGIIEISKKDDNFIIINELPFEEYLYSVVSSEIPESYGVEASKVQALIARSYAYNKFYENKFLEYGANIDDSTKTQVYNNIFENEVSIKGVEDTKGLYIFSDDKVADTKFFSTSIGVTANSGEVWPEGITKKFPTDTEKYLRSKNSSKNKKNIDLSKEENIKKFLENKDIEAFDKKSPWFRWNVEMTTEEIEASINKNLKEIYTNSPYLIKVLEKDKTYINKEIDTIGKLKKIEVIKRGQGGNIMELKIEGTKNTIIVMTENVIRNLIKPKKYLEKGKDIKLNKLDGTYSLNYFIMPSSFYIIENIKDDKNNIKSIKLYGGGNGHGVGLSQNGAKGMLDEGYKLEDILLHYYDGVKIDKLVS